MLEGLGVKSDEWADAEKTVLGQFCDNHDPKEGSRFELFYNCKDFLALCFTHVALRHQGLYQSRG